MEPKHLLKLDFQPVPPRASRAGFLRGGEGVRLPVRCRAKAPLAALRAWGGAG